MDEEVVIAVRNVNKTYQLYNSHSDRVKETFHPLRKKYHYPFNALNDVSFDVRKGQKVGIIGCNGSGKSTLLHIICGTLTPTRGQVRINGRVAALLELGAGFNPEFTGRENIYINAAVMGLSRSEIDARFQDIVAFADIGEFIDQPVKTYSSGMYVRLAFAVIAHVNADILIVDEALAVGDAYYVQKCMHFIRRFCQTGTLCFVSHDTQAVLDLCDRTIWLDRGIMKLDGNARDVVREYNAFIHGLVISDKTIQVHKGSESRSPNKASRLWDHRKMLLTGSVHRNLFELFDFDFNSLWWGKGDAHVLDIKLFDTYGEQISVTEGGELIELRIYCRTNIELRKPVVGFCIRNQRGVELMSDNTYLTYKDPPPPPFLPGEDFYASFKFLLPYLKSGSYTIGGAIADGVPGAHIQHHRRDEALHFKVHASHIVYGLFGMPIIECSIEKCHG